MSKFLISDVYIYTCERIIEADDEADAMAIFDAEPLVSGKDTYDHEHTLIEEVVDN